MKSLYPLLCCVLLTSIAAAQPEPKKPYRLPPVDLKQRIIWAAECREPEGSGLAFGGQDQQANEMRAITRTWKDGYWQLLDLGELDEEQQAQREFFRNRDARRSKQGIEKQDRDAYFGRGEPLVGARLTALGGDVLAEATECARLFVRSAEPRLRRRPDLLQEAISATWGRPAVDWEDLIGAVPRLWTLMVSLALETAHHESNSLHLAQPRELERHLQAQTTAAIEGAINPLNWKGHIEGLVLTELFLRDALENAPSPRALASLAYDPKSKFYVLFGGDRLDCLMNDTWVFDTYVNRWVARVVLDSPPPRANAKLIDNGDGTLTLKGGYTYSNSTDYMGGPYVDIDVGDWTYDVAKNEWKGSGKAVPPWTRTYRTGPCHPSYFIRDPPPDRAFVQESLDGLPANQWKKMNPPHLPQMNRDWGTAVLDTDRDMILRYSGGHCAHGGTDVLHYHLGLNRWELTRPVELPLGQTYTNTEYPDGWNFNRRPWITGHTYQSYAYDTYSRQMIFVGRPKHIYYYDPTKGDWAGTRDYKPKGMAYNDCFYTLTLTPTPDGLVCWTAEGKLFHNEQVTLRWVEVPITGEKLPGSVVDNSTLAFDSKRNRLLFFRKGYGDKAAYDGEVYELDWKTRVCRKLGPNGMKEAAAVPYLCQIRYDPEHDLMLVGATLPPDADGLHRTPAYDCANNRWVSLRITGDDPSGKTGRNVSLGLMFDPKRKLWWAVDAKSQVYVLRLDPANADVRALKNTDDK